MDDEFEAKAEGVQAIIETAQEAVDPFEVFETGGQPKALVHVVPLGASVQVTDLEPFLIPYRDRPRRRQGFVKVSTVESLIDFINDEGPDALTVWVHPSSGRVEAILNDNHPAEESVVEGTKVTGYRPSAPGWRDHKAILTLEETPEWRFWVTGGNNGRLLSQEEFAKHIERGLLEITDPDGATMLEMAQNMHVSSSANIQSAKRTMGDIQVTYTQEQTAKTGGAGQYDFPAKFELVLAPFIGEEPQGLIARTTYRVDGGQLRVGYTIDRPEAVVNRCIEGLVERLKDADFARVYIGTPN